MGARHRPYGRGILAVGPSLIANWFHVFLVIISMPIGVVANAHRHEGTYFLRIIAKALWALGIGRICRGILAVGPSLIGLGSYCEPRMPIGVAAYDHRHQGTSFLRIIAKARRHYGRQASAIWPSHMGSRPGPHRELVSCISCDNLDAHRRCGLRSSASRYILSAHYRQGSAALWALGIGHMAEAYWQSARASSRIGFMYFL